MTCSLKQRNANLRNKRLNIFGLVVQEGKLAMNLAKLKGILAWPTPKTVKEVQSFLGFGNFYQEFLSSGTSSQ